jgi:hypothetical protein
MDNGQRQASAVMIQSRSAALGICPHLAGLRWMRRKRRDMVDFYVCPTIFGAKQWQASFQPLFWHFSSYFPY